MAQDPVLNILRWALTAIKKRILVTALAASSYITYEGGS
jgi:hypothetical protein